VVQPPMEKNLVRVSTFLDEVTGLGFLKFKRKGEEGAPHPETNNKREVGRQT